MAEKALSLCENGAIDVLVNNGGLSSRSRFVDTLIDVDEYLMRVNFFSGAQLAKRLVPQMRLGAGGNNGGKIIWISSVQGLLGTPYRTSYAASKFAVQGYCQALRSELSSENITVHVASPGYISTDLSRSAKNGDGSQYGKMDKTTANGADPDDVALKILDSVAKGKMDFVVAVSLSAKVALLLKFILPSFLHSILVKRYEKARILEESQDQKKNNF